MKIRTYSTGDGYTIEFSQGVQTFALDYKSTTEVEAEWMADQLKIAFRNFIHEIQIETIKEYSEKQLKYICKCVEPINQMTNNGMYCLRCENPKGGSPKQNF